MNEIVDFVSPNAPDLPSKELVRRICPKVPWEDISLIHVHNGNKFFIENGVEWKNQQFLFDRIRRAPLFIFLRSMLCSVNHTAFI